MGFKPRKFVETKNIFKIGVIRCRCGGDIVVCGTAASRRSKDTARQAVKDGANALLRDAACTTCGLRYIPAIVVRRDNFKPDADVAHFFEDSE
ncbi:hypothetical protein LCGC14_1533140 [marine sediment metagenome]|uniref:Uncharacterized protein n=1 Tax=marine sediment metagenome TaxID=412755 RepID=A0A0F9IVD9_9ZZZZ